METSTRIESRAAKAERRRYQLRNLPTRMRALPLLTAAKLARKIGLPVAITELRAVHHKADGSEVDLGVLSNLIVTTAGVNYLASTFLNTAEPETINFSDSGTGVTAAAIGDTALQTPTGNARVSGTQTNPSANLYRSVATLPYTTTLAITEYGIFSASTVGTLFDHFVFSAVNVVNGDSITFTFTLTLTAGG